MSKRLVSALVVTAAMALPFVGCLARTKEVTFLHTQLPAKPKGCPVNRIAGDAAPYPVENLVELQINYTPGGRELALANLDDQACYYGGDTLYRMREETKGNTTTILTAVIARRVSADGTPIPSAAPSGSLPLTSTRSPGTS